MDAAGPTFGATIPNRPPRHNDPTAAWAMSPVLPLCGGLFEIINVGEVARPASGLLVGDPFYTPDEGSRHAAARTNEPAREGLVAMLGPFIDTIVICTMTALVVVISGKWSATELDGAPLSAAAFEWGLSGIGSHIVTFGLVFFAFSTLISWSYYGDRVRGYLFGPKAVPVYRWVFVLMIPVAPR